MQNKLFIQIKLSVRLWGPSHPSLFTMFPERDENLSRKSARINADIVMVFGLRPPATHWPDDKRHRHVWCNPSQMALSLVRPFIASLSDAKLCPADKHLIFARILSKNIFLGFLFLGGMLKDMQIHMDWLLGLYLHHVFCFFIQPQSLWTDSLL